MASIFILYRYVCIRKEVYMRFYVTDVQPFWKSVCNFILVSFYLRQGWTKYLLLVQLMSIVVLQFRKAFVMAEVVKLLTNNILSYTNVL